MTDSKLRVSSFACLLSLVAACGASDPATGMTDAGGIVVDAGPAMMCNATIPASPYGIEVGRKFEPLTLPDCSGNNYDFYNQDYCDASLTVVSIAAGWCNPCIIESSMLTSVITEPYAPRGVRVIQIVYQTDTYDAPDAAYCQGWVDRFGLTNVELYDPTQLASIYFPAGSLPATLIVDNQGVIRFREYGVSDGLMTLRAKLDQLLAEQGL